MSFEVKRKSLFGFKASSTASTDLYSSFKSCLDSLGIDYDTNVEVGGKTFNFCSGKCLIDVNPTQTHNIDDLLKRCEGTKDNPETYHQEKALTARLNEYSTFQIFDWDNVNKIAAMLLPKTRVYARKCAIEPIDQKTANDFLKMHHLQGAARGQTVCYGLYLNGSLISVMTFGKPRYNKNFEWELIRLCYHPEYSVTGGSEKLFKKFLQDHHPVSIISYCDKSKFSGRVYYNLGMTLKSEGLPSKHWYSSTETEKSKHITNNFLLQRGYDQIFNESYGKGTSNEELIRARGYLPVFDCGQMTFEWRI